MFCSSSFFGDRRVFEQMTSFLTLNEGNASRNKANKLSNLLFAPFSAMEMPQKENLKSHDYEQESAKFLQKHIYSKYCIAYFLKNIA